jgi:hypothetical protein
MTWNASTSMHLGVVDPNYFGVMVYYVEVA